MIVLKIMRKNGHMVRMEQRQLNNHSELAPKEPPKTFRMEKEGD